jgi:16S rRNA (cytosine967-C5)-methyltransferase
VQTASLIGHTQEVLLEILKFNKPADALFQLFFRSRKYLGSKDRKFIAETGYGTLRHLRTCESRIRLAVKEELFEEDRALLLICAYLSLSPNGSLELSSTEIAPQFRGSRVREDLDGIFSTLKMFQPTASKGKAQTLGEEYSFQDWMVERWVKQFGEEETLRFCASLNEPAPLTIRVNALRASLDVCREKLKAEGVETELVPDIPNALRLKKRINIFQLQTFKDGFFEMQDAGSQMLPNAIDPRPTSKVLDACAGAGGKTLQFAALMKNRGEIFASDVQGFRLEELSRRSKRAGAQNVRIKPVESLSDLHDKFTGFFDIVFIDAPCSGVGTIRRNPGMKWSVTEAMVTELSEKQRLILEQCAPLVKPGGKMVYATCSLFAEENEVVVGRFITDHAEYALSQIRLAKTSSVSLSPVPFDYLLPHQRDTDGFFCAALTRAR